MKNLIQKILNLKSFTSDFISAVKKNSLYLKTIVTLTKLAQLTEALTLKVINKIFKGKEEKFYKIISPYKNQIYIFIASIFAALFIFYFMTLLISQNKSLLKKTGSNVFINFLSSKEIEDLKTKDRKIPDKPKEAEKVPDTPRLKAESQELSKPQIDIPQNNLELPKNLAEDQSFGISGGGGSNYGNSDVTPIVRIEPIYPRNAAMTGTEGFVILQFDISPIGSVTNISILQASPPQIFNRNAVQALKRWKYKPRVLNNKAVVQKGLKVRLDFKLEK